MLDVYKVKEKGFFSQYGQDKYIAETYFNNKKQNIFVEIGANDGISNSNTYYFEKELSWSGLAIEPLPKAFKMLEKNRNCATLNGCISDFNGETKFLAIDGYAEQLSGIIDKYDKRHVLRIEKELKEFKGTKKEISVNCYTLENVLENHSISSIDYLSIDTEGGEFNILKSLNLKKIKVDVISVENNYYSLKFLFLLRRFGYKLVAIAGSDEIYKKYTT